MRPLSRPMFRNGGPIKEGIMDGMQHRKAALVGDPAFPMDQSGRGMYSEQQIASNLQKIKEAFSQTAKDIKTKPLSTVNPLKKTGIIGSFLKRNAGRIKNFYDRQVGKLDMPPKFKPAGPEFKGAGTAGGGSVPTTLLERAKFFATKNPKTTIGGGYLASGPVVDVATGSVPLAKKVGLQIADLAVPDFIFDQDKYFADKEIRERNEKAKQKSLEAGTTKKTGGEGEDTVKKLSRDEEIEDEFHLEAYYAGDDTIEIGLVINPLREPESYTHIEDYLTEYIRHEIRHAEQEVMGTHPGKTKEDLKGLAYYTQDHEIDAQTSGLNARRIKQGRSFEEVIRGSVENTKLRHGLSDEEG